MSGIFLTALAFATVASAAGPAPVDLRTAGNYAILARAGVSTVPSSDITGDLGVSPQAATYYTGFSTTRSDTGTYSTSDQVTGRLYSASDASPTPSVLTTAVSDMETAYDDASGRTNPDFLNVEGGSVSGYTFQPGLYNWGTDLDITADCYINGTANDTFILQVASQLNVESGVKIILQGGAVAENVVWVVGSSTTLESTVEFNGVILGKTAIHMNTASSITGRLLAQSAVTLQQATVQSTGLNETSSAPSSSSKRSTRYSADILN
ncbi:hypothetical protein P7C70_g770, partial [Phenoliferia sp. Uapishka_3]